MRFAELSNDDLLASSTFGVFYKHEAKNFPSAWKRMLLEDAANGMLFSVLHEEVCTVSHHDLGISQTLEDLLDMLPRDELVDV